MSDGTKTARIAKAIPDNASDETLINVASWCLSRIDGGREAVEAARDELDYMSGGRDNPDGAKYAASSDLFRRLLDAMPEEDSE